MANFFDRGTNYNDWKSLGKPNSVFPSVALWNALLLNLRTISRKFENYFQKYGKQF